MWICVRRKCLESISENYGVFSLSLSAYASKQIARPHSPAVVLKARVRSLPTKILDILKYGHIQSQGRKSAKQQGLAP